MRSVTLQTRLAGPSDVSGTCKVSYSIEAVSGVVPEILVVRYIPPAYKGASATYLWEHVAYPDELSNLPVIPADVNKVSLIRKASADVVYTSLDLAEEAITSIRAQVKRLLDDLNIIDQYSSTNTWVIQG